jgi:hypothetical protein
LVSASPDAHLTERNIKQTGERIDTVATAFELIPEFQRVRLEA